MAGIRKRLVCQGLEAALNRQPQARPSRGPKLRDALKLLLPNADFRDAALNYRGEPITVSWPSDNGRQTVTRTFYPPFTPVDREEDYRVACEFLRGRQ